MVLKWTFAPQLVGIQQVGAAARAAKSVISCFHLRLVITSG